MSRSQNTSPSSAAPNRALDADWQGHQVIAHVDMDAFFASVEQLVNPELRDRPLIVGGNSQRGVVASCSYEARSYGIRSAMPSVRAKRLCPHAVFVPGNFGLYMQYSDKVMSVLKSFTPLVEPLSVDEAFLDVTGSQRLFGSPAEIGWQIRAAVFDETELDCSVGIGNTKHLAKLASVQAKPKASRNGPIDGLGVNAVIPKRSLDFLHPLPVRAIWGIGPKSAERLTQLGIATVGQLATTPRERLLRAVGEVTADHLLDLANNRDDREVITDHARKSVGHQQTHMSDIVSRDQLHHEMARLADAVASRLRAKDEGGRTITVKVRYGDFRSITRGRTLKKATASTADLLKIGDAIVDEIDVSPGVRLLGLTVSNLEPLNMSQQLSFDAVEDGAQKEVVNSVLNRALDATMDEVRARFGESSIVAGQLLSGAKPGKPSLLRHETREWGPTRKRDV